MNNDAKKNANPLLNVAITGSTIEDFTQNAVLLPAAELPPPSPPLAEQPTPEIRPLYSSANIETNRYQLEDQLNQAGATFENIIDNTSTAQSVSTTSLEAATSDFSNERPPTRENSFQSVFSSFSSYLNIGGKSNEQIDAPIPSIVDNLQPLGPAADAVPIPFYTPDTTFAPPPASAAPAPANLLPSSNSFRRGGLKRPAYAPIPGLGTGSPILSSESVSKIPPNLPPLPTKSPSPLTPFAPKQLPLQTTVSPSDPSLSDVIHRPSSPQIQQIQRLKDSLEGSSPFLHPVPSSEAVNLPSPLATYSNTVAGPTIHTSTSYIVSSQHSALINPNMPKLPESSRTSPGMSNQQNLGLMEPDATLTTNEASFLYRPVYHHWFYKKNSEKTIWCPFSMQDSLNLETAYLSNDLSPEKLVATDGGRYDVNILKRERVAVFWESPNTEVGRCSWFHKGNNDGRYVPYEENIAAKLEEEYKCAFESNTWNRKVELPNGETLCYHGPDVLVLFSPTQGPDSWGNTPNQPRPKVVKRGMDEFHIEDGEPNKVDHVLFLVHGIGSVCDLKFRTVEEVVDEFRSVSLQLTQSHYKSSCEKEIVNRIEVLPISWHDKLHAGENGVDNKMKGITLESIPRLRNFTNGTILDVLFYTSPVYAQVIISRVGNEINRLFDLFKQRNPSFSGEVSLGGHSLGSLILFDILCHQHPNNDVAQEQDESGEDTITNLKPHPSQRKMSRRISYMMGEIGTGQPQLTYPQLSFHPVHFFALGSPIGMYVTVRGLDNLGEQFALPTCRYFFNIFHPYDPVAYRIEPLVNSELATLKPVLIPHHKGRKRMHLELKETMARVGADLKQKVLDSMKSTWNSFYQFSLFKSGSAQTLEDEVDKVLGPQLNSTDSIAEEDESIEAEPTDLSLGILNQGRRFDFVLQEAPLEFFNDYIFAVTSHVCYWDSEDTMLMIIREIYNSRNVSPDTQIPQQTMTIERATSAKLMTFVDPTRPMSVNADLEPPPKHGFVKKK